MNLKIGSAGGKTRAIIQHREALDSYYANPNHCLCCSKLIVVPDGVKVTEIRRKKFCNRSCAAQYNNKHYPKRHCTQEREGICQRCNTPILFKLRDDGKGYSVRRFCERCRAVRRFKNGKLLEETSKGELFKKSKSWQSARSVIQRNARNAFILSGKPKICGICGYDKHIDTAHIKRVSDFPDSTLISVINHPDNLMALCPNHHWEYDQGLLTLGAKPA